LELFKKFPPDQDQTLGKTKFIFKGPLLLTKAFESKSNAWIINVIKNAKFQKQNIESGNQIDGFEKHFTFFYPKDDYPGALYTYQPTSTIQVSTRDGSSTSNPLNLSSTILVINDPISTNPLISLNGDASGHSIIQSLNGKCPKIFKVSQHGSIHNSIALKDFVLHEAESTQKLLATLSLLQVALNKKETFLNKQITLRSFQSFNKKFAKQQSHEMKTQHKGVKLNPINFDNHLEELANKFNKAMVDQGITSAQLMQTLVKLTDVIDENLKNPNVSSVDLYTHSIRDKKELDDFIKYDYDVIKNKTFNATTHTQKEAYGEIYSMLETDETFSSKLAFRLSKAFYLKINAQTYFISSGSFCDHPNWEVVNGIIAAAHDRHQKDANYKCRLLLTSGKNIMADKFGKLGSTDDWKEYVSLQYFASNTASVEIDSEESNPLTVLPGTVEWQGGLSEQKQNELLAGYNQTKGAQELKVARATSSGQYEINPSTDDNSWLAWHSSSKKLVLSSQKVAIAVESIGVIFAKSLQNIATKFEFRNSPSCFQFVYGLSGVDTPASNIISYPLYTHSEDEKNMYLTITHGCLSTTDKKDDATHFQFKSVPVSTEHSADCTVDMLDDDNNASMILEEFLQLVQYSGDTITCKKLLHILVSQQFTSNLLTEWSLMNGIFPCIVDKSSTFLVQDTEVISANIKLKLLATPLKLHGYSITGAKLAINSPKTVDQTVTLQLDTTDEAVPVTFELKSETNVSNFQKYLISLGIKKIASTFKIFDAVIFLLQSETSAFVFLSSLSRKMLGDILEWSIDEKGSSVEFVEFPTGPVVTSADIVAKIPDDCSPLNLGWKGLLKINKIGFTLPNQLESADPMYLFANAIIGRVELKLKALAPDVGMLPTFDVSLTKPLPLNDVTNLLQVSSQTFEFAVPLTSDYLKDVKITKTVFTYQQGIQGTQQVYLKEVAFGFEFENLAKYLPTSFSSLQSIGAVFKIYQPNITPVQVALEVQFKFKVTISKVKKILLNASIESEPILASIVPVGSYNFTVSIQTTSVIIGTPKGGISLNDFLQVFGLSNALQAAHSIPILSSIFANIELKKLVLGMNTNNKEVNKFILELIIFNWIIIAEKITIKEASISMNYTDNCWATKFDTKLKFSSRYSVDAHFELSGSDQSLKMSFTNRNNDFTIAKFLDVFGLDGLNNLPVVGQFMNITIKEASLEMMKGNEGEVKLSEGRVSLYAKSIEIGSLFKLLQVNATIKFIFDQSKKEYVFGFSVRGFITEKLYLDVEYDHSTSILSGQVAISPSSTANLTEVIKAVDKKAKDVLDKNDVFQRISESSTVSITIAIKHVSGGFKLTDFVFSLNYKLPIGPISLQKLQLEYHHKSNEVIQSQDVYRLVGELVNEKKTLNVNLELDLTRDSTGEGSFTASLTPARSNSLTLKSLLDIASPVLPEIEGQTLPRFFDIALNKGSISVSVPTFQIVELMCTISLRVGEQNYDFSGKFCSNNARSEFTGGTDHAVEIVKPLGMFGICLNDARLQMICNYPQKKPHSSSQTVLANVSFYSNKEVLTVSIVLKCFIFFKNYSATVVKIALKPTDPLTIADFVKTVFEWDYDVYKYLNIGFVNGKVYFAKLEEGTKSILIDGATYKNGYHISADVHVFDILFTINADISSSQVNINGHANAPLDLGFAKLTGVDDSDPRKPDVSKSPELSFATDSSSTSISLNVGLVLFDVPLGTTQLHYKRKSNKMKVFFGEITYHKSIGIIENPFIEFEWSKECGFKVTNWSIVGLFEDEFNFFNALQNHKKYKSVSGALVKLAIKHSVKTQFKIKVNLSRTKHPEKFLADIDIAGTYEILLLKEEIASFDIPNISIGIPKEDKFTLGKLPKFIIQQIIHHPDFLTEAVVIAVLEICQDTATALVSKAADSSTKRLATIIKGKIKTFSIQASRTTEEASVQVAKGTLRQGGQAAGVQVAKSAVTQGGRAAGVQVAKSAAVNAVKQGFKVNVVTGVLIEGGIYSVQMGRAAYKVANSQMDTEEFMKYTAEETATAGGSAVGGIGGSLAGAAAGAAVGSVVPLVGTAIGGVVGGIVGGIAGGIGGNLLGKEVGDQIKKKINNNWKLGCSTPTDIAVGCNNEFIVLKDSPEEVSVVSSKLMEVNKLSKSGIKEPSSIAVSGFTIAIGDRINHVVKIYSIKDREKKYVSMIDLDKEKKIDFPDRMQFNSKGVLYVLDFYNAIVKAFDTLKKNATCGTVGSEGSLPKQPKYIAVDSSDNVYVGGLDCKYINMYSRNDHRHTFLCKIDCFCKPCAIAFSPDNHLIVGDHENNCIRVFSLPHKKSFLSFRASKEKEHSRKPTNIFGAVGKEKEEFEGIIGIAVNGNGTICVAESKNERLQLIGTSIWRKTMDEKDIKKYI